VSRDYQGTTFSGVFDGNGCVIANLAISPGGAGYSQVAWVGWWDTTVRIWVMSTTIIGTGGQACKVQERAEGIQMEFMAEPQVR